MTAHEDAHQHEMQIHVPGILKVLGEALYSKPAVALRELLQNSQDSIVRRRTEHRGKTPPPGGWIRVRADREQGTLSVEDNGSGLTESEIHVFLSTVGRGYTGEMRTHLDLMDPQQARELIGQFGLGMLSAFLIADEIRAETRSVRGEESLIWHARGEGTYTLTAGERTEPGTCVTLQLKPSRLEMLDTTILEDTIRTYADFLPVPIHLQDETEPVNAMDAPWHQPPTRGSYEGALRRFMRHRYPRTDMLAVIPLADVQVVQGRETLTLPMSGVLGIPGQSRLSTGEHGDVAVYVRRMMVEERCRELLPPWARFVTGVVESAALQPTASRESVRRDWAFKTLQEAIGKRILAYLRETASEEPAQFRKIVGTHNALIKAWALEFPEIFPVVADLVVFDTGLGPLTLPEVHARVQEADTRGMLRVSWKARPLYYTDDRQAAAQARLLLESRGVPVIDASHGWEHMFLERYAELQQDVELVAIRAGDRSVFAEPPPAEKAKWDRLVEACDQLGIRAIAASFEPRILPALLVLDEEEQQVIAARRLTERMDVIGQLREVVEQIAGRLEEGYSRRGILYLNTLHPLIQKLAARDPEDPDVLRVLSLLYGHAALLEQRSLTRDAALRLFSESADALRHFLRV